MIHTIIEEQRSAPKDWGKISISVVAAPMNSSKAEKIQKVVEDCLDQLQEAVTGQPPLPLGTPQPDKPVRGQKKLPLTKDGLVEGSQDKKTPAEFEVEEVQPGEIAAKGEAFGSPGGGGATAPWPGRLPPNPPGRWVPLPRRKDGPDVVIEFDEPWHIDEVEPDPAAVESRAGFTVWARWRDNQVVGYAGPEDLEIVKKHFWDAVLMQYVQELRSFAGMAKN